MPNCNNLSTLNPMLITGHRHGEVIPNVAGLLILAAVASLALILICMPLRHGKLEGSKSSKSTASKVSGDAAQIFLGTKGKLQAGELEVAGSKGDKMGRSKVQATAELTQSDVADSVAGYASACILLETVCLRVSPDGGVE